MARSKKIRRLVVVAPMRSHCETVANIFTDDDIPVSYLEKKHGPELAELRTLEHTFGIIAGTGTGKTVFIRDIAEHHFGPDFIFDIVTREHESTAQTWKCNVLIVTSGIAMHYLKAGYINDEDVIIIDEIHQTSSHLELTMALAKHRNVPVNFMSATIDPEVYKKYFKTDKILECHYRDPAKRASVESLIFEYGRPGPYDSPGIIKTKNPWIEHYLERMGNLQEIINGKRGVAVFLPTKAMCEQFSKRYQEREGLHVDFYHGGEPASKLKAYLTGAVPKPFIIFMTVAGASSLNIEGLDWVIIHDETYKKVVYFNVKTLQKFHLGPTTMLQMGGRVDGRKAGSKITILSDRSIAYRSLEPENPEFVLSGDLEDVALICANLQIDLTELNPIGAIDHEFYKETWQMLVDRELITPQNTLTSYGKEVDKIPVSRIWSEHVVYAHLDEYRQLLPHMIICSACPSLFSMLNRDGEYDIDDFIVKGNDFLTKYNIIKFVIDNFTYIWIDRDTGKESFRLAKEFYDWTKKHGLYSKTIKEILIAVTSVSHALKLSLKKIHRAFPDVDSDAEIKFKQLLLEVDAFELLNYAGACNSTSGAVTQSKVSVCQRETNRGPMYGEISVFRNRGIDHYNIEGVLLDFDDFRDYLAQETREFQNFAMSEDGQRIIVRYSYPGFGFSHFIDEKIKYQELPDDHDGLGEAEKCFADFLADNPHFLPDDIRHSNEAIIDRVKEFQRQQLDVFENSYKLLSVGRDCYWQLLAGTDVYNLHMAAEKNLCLALNLRDFVSEEEEAEMEEHLAREKEEQAERQRERAEARREIRRMELEDLRNHPPVRATQISHRPEFVYRHALSPVCATDALPKSYKKKKKAKRTRYQEAPTPVQPTEPQGQTPERVEWLEEKVAELEAQVVALKEEKTAKQADADALGQAYSRAHGSKNGAIKELGKWQKACKAVEDVEQKIDKLKTKISPLEDEALEIMEVLEQ